MRRFLRVSYFRQCMAHRSLAALIVVLSAWAAASAVRGESIEWTRQLGTDSPDQSFAVSADGLGNVYISGITQGSLGGPNAGSGDAFVSKYNAAGTPQWTRQLGTSSSDISYGVSADGLGNVYISGFTRGSLGGPIAGIEDAFVSKYDAAGTLQWTRQLGTSGFAISSRVSADGLGNVYISGWTNGSLGGPNAGGFDAFISKYDAAGTLLGTRQLGTSKDDQSRGVSADGLGNVYISGSTEGSLGGPNVGGVDAFVSKYDAVGALQWTRQLGAIDGATTSYDVSADGLGNVYISGTTFGSLGGPNLNSADAFVSKYNAAGALQWTRQSESGFEYDSYGVSADGLGNVYFSGLTNFTVGPPNADDAFVAKIVDAIVPPLADFNGDGKVDADDLAAWSMNVGLDSGALNSEGDADFDGDIDGADFLIWQRAFGASAASLPAAAAVPEPTTMAFASAAWALGILVIGDRRRAPGTFRNSLPGPKTSRN